MWYKSNLRGLKKLGISLIAFSSMALSVSADVVSVDFNSATSPTYSGQSVFLDKPGGQASSPFNNFWNEFESIDNNTDSRVSGGLLQSDGVTPTAVYITLNNVNVGDIVSIDDGVSSFAAANAFDLMRDGLTLGNTGRNRVVIRGLIPGEGYMLYIYGVDPVTGFGGNFTVGSTTQGAFSFTPGSDPSTPDLSDAEDYVMIHAFADSVGEINYLFEGATPGITNGFQIVGPFSGQTALTSQEPVVPDVTEGVSYELGTTFIPAVDGEVTAIRYWHAASQTGTPTGNLWTAGGTNLASVSFADSFEPAESGWRQVELPSPVSVQAGQTYVVSVSTNDFFPITVQGLSSAITNDDLTIPQGGGVFSNANSPGTFPSNTFRNSHYFRDVVFIPVE